MSDDTFDFNSFMAKMGNPDDATRREILREGVEDQMGNAMEEVGPRLWAVLRNEMGRDPQNNIHLNAVLNAAVFSILSWVAACTPRGETNGRSNDEILTEKITANLKVALDGRSDEQAKQLAMLATHVGQVKLAEDTCDGIAKILSINSSVIQGIHREIQEMKKGG